MSFPLSTFKQKLPHLLMGASMALFATAVIDAGASKAVVAVPVQQVPGPLPVLGAVAAFDFSRRLRRRVKSGV